MGMKAGDRVVCIDDTGWLIPDPGFEHLAPKKGGIYVIREYTKVGGVGAVSLVGGYRDHFYRACRFRPVAGLRRKRKAAAGVRPAATASQGA